VTRFHLASDTSRIVEVVTAGLACCTLEIEAAVTAGHLIPASSLDPELDGVAEVSVVVIAGTVTDALLPSVLDQIATHRHAKVMSFGACATSGGPYWDSPPVTKGIDQFTEVATYVAGCPPRPEAFMAALRSLMAVNV
jgi:NADH-quinone oxidoreductase subunit B